MSNQTSKKLVNVPRDLHARFRRLQYEHSHFVAIVVIFLISIVLLAIFKALFGEATTLANVIDGLLSNIVFAIIASTVIVATLEFFSNKKQVEAIREEVGDVFRQQLEGANINLTGVKQIHLTFPNEYFASILNDSSRLFILQTYIANLNSMKIYLKNFCESGGKKIEVILLDPESKYVDLRAPEITMEPEAFRTNINQNIIELRKLANAFETPIEIRLQNQTPSVSIYGLDSVLFVGNYLHELHAVQAPTLELTYGVYYDTLTEHFQRIWEKSKPAE